MLSDPLLLVQNLKKYYPVKKRGLFSEKPLFLKAVDGVDLTVHRGEIVGLVGESGCGKSTLGRLVLRLEEPTEGSILFGGEDLSCLREKQLRSLRKCMQIIFQDPYASLNPRKRAGTIIEEPLIIHGVGDRESRRAQVAVLMSRVGLDPGHKDRYPHEFSGGQRQRIAIARALALQPRLVVADEPTSALDVSVQAQIVNLLLELKEKLQLTYLLIAHDLNVIKHMSDRVAVMYLGRMVEMVEKQRFGLSPCHPYTEALVAAAPLAVAGGRPNKRVVQGEVPSGVTPPSGCVFHTRCPYMQAICSREIPFLKEVASKHQIACHFRV